MNNDLPLTHALLNSSSPFADLNRHQYSISTPTAMNETVDTICPNLHAFYHILVISS